MLSAVRAAVIVLALACLGACPAFAQVDVVGDMVAAGSGARAFDAAAATVQRPAVSGGVRRPGIMLHPRVGARPARMAFKLRLAKVPADALLLLAFDYGISDGARLDDPTTSPDGVRFAVEVDGRSLFEAHSRESAWRSGAADLTPWAGRTVDVALLTYAGANAAYDWALWGRPRVLRVHGGVRTGTTVARAPNIGVVTVQVRPGCRATIRVMPDGGAGRSAAVVNAVSAPPGRPGWAVVDYDLADAASAAVTLEPADAVVPGSVRVAAHPALVCVDRVGASSAVVRAGDASLVLADVRNAGAGMLRAGAASVSLRIDGTAMAVRRVPALRPGQSWQARWPWRPRWAGRHHVSAALTAANVPTPRLGRALHVFAPLAPSRVARIERGLTRIEFVREGGGYAYARVLARRREGWRQVAVWRPLMRAVLAGPRGDADWEMRPPRCSVSPGAHGAELAGTLRDPLGAAWRVSARVDLGLDGTVGAIRVRARPDRAVRLRALWGPNLYVGDGTWGERKTWALFPGLEWLHRGEASSSPRGIAPPKHDRRTPAAGKVTIPLMAVTLGPDSVATAGPSRFWCPDSAKDLPAGGLRDAPPGDLTTVALMWDPAERWDGAQSLPSVRFASPNREEAMHNHRMGLFVPSTPTAVPENAQRAAKPYRVPAGRAVSLSANLVVQSGPALGAIGTWLSQRGGLPKPSPAPRDWHGEMALCRDALLNTVSDAPTGKWRAAIEFAPEHMPGLGALLWWYARVEPDPTARDAADARVRRAADAMLADRGARLFTQRAGCHIMRWEFPFVFGHLPEALEGAEAEIRSIIGAQQPDGGWRFGASDPQHAGLGQTGDSVVGLNCHSAWMLMRWARITGDPGALAAGTRSLTYMERFRVPRGAGPWECPIYEPDILAAAWTLPAYLEGWMATGDPRWLHDAVYWAETGVPFVYLWSLPDRPMMLGASIPLFGSTFYTHSWLGMPVQWEGLVYAYHLRRLARALETARPIRGASPHTSALGLSPADWRGLADLQLVSGMHQQVPDGPRKGTYPDSISDFRTRNPVFIGPENLMACVLDRLGHAPDVSTARIHIRGQAVVVSSGARVDGVQAEPGGVTFRLGHFAGQVSHTLVAGLRPTEVRVDGAVLAHSPSPVRQEPGWWYDATRARLYISTPHAGETVTVRVTTEGSAR